MPFIKIFYFKIVLLKTSRKTQKLRVLWGKMNQNVIFFVQNFFENCFLKIFFFLQSRAFKNIYFLQNRASKMFFSSKSCF